MAEEAFGIEKEFMHAVLREVRDGKAQLPEFQRGWVWPDENIRSLLASVSLAYPVGTVMMLRTGGTGVRFKQRPIQGATPPSTVHAERLILDGQQRLTSLFQSLMLETPVEAQDARKRPVAGWFYIDMIAALDPATDREEAIRFIPVDRTVRNFRGEVQEDYSTRELEWSHHLFPLNRVFDADDWQMGFQEHWDYDKEKMQLWNRFNREVVKRFEQYQLPVIELGSDTDRQAVCQVFEKVNTGGVTLTVFELLTATFAADEFDLRRDWEERERQLKTQDKKVLSEFANTDFLQAVTLLVTRDRRQQAINAGTEPDRAPRIGCRRQDMLALDLDSYLRFAPLVVDGLIRSAKFLHSQHFFDTKFLPYGSQLVPMAAIFAVLGLESENAGAREKIARWFWCGVMGELYGGTTETRFSRDLPEVVDWVRGRSEPRTVADALFPATRLRTLRTRNSAAYKGLYALLLREGARDWRTGQEATIAAYYDEATDIHHVFPKAWCESSGVAASDYDSIINKTPLSARTNRVIGGRAPSEYLSRLANSASINDDELDRHVSSHLIDPALLRTDSFDSFLEARSVALLSHIERAMGKAPALGNASDDPPDPATYEDMATQPDDA